MHATEPLVQPKPPLLPTFTVCTRLHRPGLASIASARSEQVERAKRHSPKLYPDSSPYVTGIGTSQKLPTGR